MEKLFSTKWVSDAKNLGTAALKYISDHKSSFLSSVNYSSKLQILRGVVGFPQICFRWGRSVGNLVTHLQIRYELGAVLGLPR